MAVGVIFRAFMLTALQIGTDRALLRSRGAVLESVGLRVVNAESVSSAMESIAAVSFDLVLFCHSLPRTDRLNLASAVRLRTPSAHLLLVSFGCGSSPGDKDGMNAVLESEPRALLRGLRGFLDLPAQEPSAIGIGVWRRQASQA